MTAGNFRAVVGNAGEAVAAAAYGPVRVTVPGQTQAIAVIDCKVESFEAARTEVRRALRAAGTRVRGDGDSDA